MAKQKMTKEQTMNDTQKTKDGTPRIMLKTRNERRCSERG